MRFSIVTPTYNSARHLAATIESVLGQAGDFAIQYIIVDGRSSDATLAIVADYAQRLRDRSLPIDCNDVSIELVSEADAGMYDAVNKGFARADGDIFAWINSDDVYMPEAFARVAQVFAAFPHINWLKGITAYIDAVGETTCVGELRNYRRDWLQRGLYGRDIYFVQQDSVFWRAALWQKAGPIDARLKLAGDYDLWLRFARYDALCVMNVCVSAFRKTAGQLSENFAAYLKECRAVSSPGVYSQLVKFYFSAVNRLLPERLQQPLYRIVWGGRGFDYIDFVRGEPVLCHTQNYRIGTP